MVIYNKFIIKQRCVIVIKTIRHKNHPKFAIIDYDYDYFTKKKFQSITITIGNRLRNRLRNRNRVKFDYTSLL